MAVSIDYRSLMVRYMANVLGSEGVAFEDVDPLSDEEKAEMSVILREATDLRDIEWRGHLRRIANANSSGKSE